MNNKWNKLLIGVIVFLVIAVLSAAFRFLNQGEPPTSYQETVQQIAPKDRPQDRNNRAQHTHVQKSKTDPSPPTGPEAEQPQDTAGMTEDDTRQVPHALTEAQREENRRELARMAEALPDNMWVPREPQPGFHPESGERLRKSIELSDKIRKGSASPEEQKAYYSYKLKETRDKIALIRYIAKRTEELSAETGKPYLSAGDIDTGEERIKELETLAETYQHHLDDLGTEAP